MQQMQILSAVLLSLLGSTILTSAAAPTSQDRLKAPTPGPALDGGSQVAQGFISAPSVPVSESSPFAEAVDGPIVGGREESTFWNCAGTILNVRSYRSLTLDITDGGCDDQQNGQRRCAGIWISIAAYLAIQNGLCDLMPCSQTASCAFAPSPTTQSATVTARPRSTRLSPPASQPAESPQSISPCARGAYHCGSLGQYTVERLVYDTVSRSTSCDASAGRGVCLIATGPLDLNIYGSIKSGTCKSVIARWKPYVPHSFPSTRNLLCDFRIRSENTLDKSKDKIWNAGTIQEICGAEAPRSDFPIAEAPSGSSCQFTDIRCPGNVHVSQALYSAVRAAQAMCDSEPCQTGGYTLSLDLWASIRNSSCQQACLHKVPSCTAGVALTPAGSQPPSSEAFMLQYGSWSPCLAQCSNESSYRALSCTSSATHIPVRLTSCTFDLQTIQMLGQVCGPEPCSSYAWQPGPWGECSAGCGLGTMWRDLSCTYLGQRVDNRYCAALSFPALTRPCYKRPCSLATWKFSSWGICNGQTQSRTVTCVNPDGTPTDSTGCQTAVGYQSATSRPCNIFSCRNNADCSGNGVCSSGACQCFTGYTGASCSVSFGPCPDVPAARSPAAASPTEAVAPMPAAGLSSTTPLCCPTGVVDHQGTCCKSALVAGSGYCCPEGSTLNNIGECCAPGVGLDACGACGSSGVAIDFLGRCCTGPLDAAGICCPLPLTVDQFGICGGFSNSGVISLNLTDATAGSRSGNQAIVTAIKSSLALNDSQISLQGRDPPGRRLLQTRGPAPSSSYRQVMVQINASGTSLPLAKAYDSLTGQGSLPAGVLVSQISAQGSPGNGLCEIGELAGRQPDCPLQFQAVRSGARGDCSGKGNAIHSQGICDCWTGYEGPDCSVCSPGYGPVNGYCLRTFVSFLGYYIAPAPAVASASLALPISIAIVGVAVILVAVSFVVIRRRHARARIAQRPKEIQIPQLQGPEEFGPESGGSKPTSSSRSSQTRPQSAGTNTDDSSPLHTKPLAYLVHWLSQNAAAQDTEAERKDNPNSQVAGGYDIFRTASDVGDIIDSHAQLPTDGELKAAGPGSFWRERAGDSQFMQSGTSRGEDLHFCEEDRRRGEYHFQPALDRIAIDQIEAGGQRTEYSSGSSFMLSSFQHSPEAPQYDPMPELHHNDSPNTGDDLDRKAIADDQRGELHPTRKLSKLFGRRFWSGDLTSS